MSKEYLNETYDLFRSQGVSIIGRGYEEIMNSPSLFEGYVTSLVEGASADSQVEMAQLMANTNNVLLQEGSSVGIAPISSLSAPVIRKLWPSFALKNAVKTEVAKTPSFLVAYTRPYYVTAGANGEEVRHYVPRPGLIADDNRSAQPFGTDNAHYIFKYAAILDNVAVLDWTEDCKVETGSLIKVQPLDADFGLKSVLIFNKTELTTAIGSKADQDKALKEELAKGTIAPVKEIVLNKKVGIENVIVVDTTIDGAYTTDNAPKDATIIVRADLEKAKATASVIMNGFKSSEFVAVVCCRGHIASEYNEMATSWSFDIAREDIRIGSGEHMNAPLTIETLTDMKALYQIDGTKAAVDLMTQAMTLNVDQKILAFLKNSFIDQPGNGLGGEFAAYPGAANYLAVFDVKPAVGFAAGPKAWREEIKPIFDHLAARIKNQTFLGSGVFNIVGNPLDIQLITNIDWSFRGGQQTVDGVSVNYSLGTFYGSSYAYKIVSSEIVPQGTMYLVFIPETNEQLTYNYYAYTFSTELGYRDPMRANVPSIMLCKRDALKAFMPAIAAVKVVGNDANAAYDPFRDYIPTRTATQAYEENAGAYEIKGGKISKRG